MTFPRWMGRFAAIFAVALGTHMVAAAAGPQLLTLEPGGFREIPQNLTVNVVFVGFSGSNTINTTAFRAALPATYRSIHRQPDFYGVRQYTGNRFNFNHKVTMASPAYADSLFAFLAASASPQPRTLFQNTYNDQGNKALAVGQNHFIDAPTVERWLAQNPPPGVDTSTYTVYFINWYGRADFKFHVYTKTDIADPDTGYNFGVNRSSRKMVAWGGSPVASGPARRVWFYDFSAGPESWNGNYDITTSDIDEDGLADYRIPVIWDYGNPKAYRTFDDLTGDAARLTRFVAINLLFTTSPLYKPAISPPVLPGAINVDLNFFQGDVTSNALDFIKPASVVAELGGLQRHNTFSADTHAYAFSARVEKTFLCFTFGPSCYGNKLGGVSFGDLFLYSNAHLLQYLDGNQGYEIPVFHYNVSDDLSGGLLGFADDNWSDGTQSYVFGFLAPGLRAAGYGFTTTTTHEVGHHLGMSHPHDGFDYELNVDYGASGSTYYAWSGDESNTIMSYIDLSTNFSQFDRDNMDRWMTAAYINHSNSVLTSILKSPKAGATNAALLSADSDAAQALARYEAMDYGNAVARAKSAYTKVLAAAASIGIKLEPQAWQADYKAKGQSPKFVDKVDYLHRHAP